MQAELGIAVIPGDGLDSARAVDVCVTCTTADRAFLGPEHVRPGTFVAGVGADNPGKQELSPALMAAATVVVDHLRQCAEGGDLRHALAAGAMAIEGVRGELAELVAGLKPGRREPDEITVFDSTGTALQDVAAAAAVYEAATTRGASSSFPFR
jgi:ornithine cyclodeaminase/alanine dehydrogenase-like protein (mu-crystallin family)